MPWQREAEFKEVLDKAIKKGSKGAIATVQKIALEDMGQVCLMSTCMIAPQVLLAILSLLVGTECHVHANVMQCYKHVCALTERHMRKVKPAQRLNALYIISTICRHSLKKHKLQDKYSMFWISSRAFQLKQCILFLCTYETFLPLQLADGVQT